MGNSKTPTCSRCGAPTAGATDQPCPACLLSGALAASTDEGIAWYESTDLPRDFGGYRLLRLLGSGGMGTVYEAEQVVTGRRVALKMLAQQLDSPEMQQRFLREGRLAASVNHQNTLYIFGSEEIEGSPVITMEIAGSGSLRDRLKKRGPFPVTVAVDAILDVISGLEAAFAAGVLHRDVKPSNCFIGADGSVKVGDFGLSVSTLAREDSYVTATGVIMGTPAYAPPEQLRGDELDVRADIYSVGATLFTLLTGRAPFEGRNAVQVVANALSQRPRSLRELREGVPPGLERVVARCLAKEPEGRYADYTALRDALLRFSSEEPEPASITVRAQAGWIDYLIAFLVPYVALMLSIGNEEFHLRFLMERTLYSARYHIAFLGFGLLYFGIVEGIWGAGLGKQLKGLLVVRRDGRSPGVGRALMRILVPILCIEGVRIPFLMATISATAIDDMTGAEVVAYSAATSICPLLPILLVLRARRANGFATLWDLASGTRVVIKPKGTARPSIEPSLRPGTTVKDRASLGPYQVIEEMVAGEWIFATDPVLRRRVSLLRRHSRELLAARRNLARPGRSRWLQKVETVDGTWDAFEATPGTPLSVLFEDGKRGPWMTLRHWLHDVASELWAASGDGTLPAELSLDQVWITGQGHAVLLDRPWPDVKTPADRTPIEDVAGQQRFLGAIAALVDPTSLPVHARRVLQNLERGKFEKLSFLTGALRGLLDKPAEINRGIRAGAIFMLPLYVWIMIFVGCHQGAEWLYEIIGDSVGRLALTTAMSVLAASALIQLLEVPFRTTFGYAIFRLAVIDAEGNPAHPSRLLFRWAVTWLPLLLPLVLVASLTTRPEGPTLIAGVAWILLWISAAVYTVTHPARGLHDWLAGTWVVRQ